MAAPLLFRGVPLLRLCLRLHQHHRFAAGTLTRRPWCAAAESSRPEEEASCTAKERTASLSIKDSPKYARWDDPDFRKWKDKEAEILRDIEPITLLIKDILHSSRYMDGDRLTGEDERTVVENLLAYHPHSEDKIGCGIHSIIVDRHPRFRCSRCLFVVRTDGVWIDFSYQKCLRAYIRHKYPPHAERFIKERFKRGSG